MCRPHAVLAPMLLYLGDVIDDSLPHSSPCGNLSRQRQGHQEDVRAARVIGLRDSIEFLNVESAWDKEMTDGILSQVEVHTSLWSVRQLKVSIRTIGSWNALYWSIDSPGTL